MAIPETTATLPRVFPLSEAARKMGVTEAVLQNMIQSGKVVAFQTSDGQMLVPMTDPIQVLPVAVADDDINARLAAIRRENFKKYEGQFVTISEASEEFGVPGRTIRDWIKQGYIHSEGKYPARVNKAEVAFCAAIYKVRKEYNSRAPLLDKDGNPYLLKEPELARLRRLAKSQAKVTT